ncbi:MAG: hypothetical protein AAGE38_04390 [Pseudomonadota bacterium]
MTKSKPPSTFRRKAVRAVAIAFIAPVIAGSVAGIALAAVLNL